MSLTTSRTMEELNYILFEPGIIIQLASGNGCMHLEATWTWYTNCHRKKLDSLPIPSSSKNTHKLNTECIIDE